jgi:flagellar hook-basal body complex protein FliE
MWKGYTGGKQMNDHVNRGGALPAPRLDKPAATGEAKGFGTMLTDAIKEINQLQIDADQAISKVQIDEAGSIHEAMIALEKADVSFRAIMQVRNKIIEAYQEIMRMQV